jgi:hypothetical protein
MLIEIKNIFILTFIFGGALILYGSYSGLYLITIIVSASIMLIYFFISLYLNTKNRQISIEQLGDSNYYLGFLFTLASILFSILSMVLNTYNIDDILYNFGLSLITTLIGLFFRIYLTNFIPTNDSNGEIINKSVYDKVRMMDEMLLENIQKNKEVADMIDTRISIIIGSTETSLNKFKKLLDKDFQNSINTFRTSIQNITDDMVVANQKQGKLLRIGYKKINRKSEQYELILDNLTKKISTLDDKIDNKIDNKVN